MDIYIKMRKEKKQGEEVNKDKGAKGTANINWARCKYVNIL